MSSSNSESLAIPETTSPELWSPIGSTLGTCIGISNSEVIEYTKCKTSWLFKYHPELLLSPITLGPARTRGIIGHSALEIFYTHLKDGASHLEAVMYALKYINQEYDEATETDDVDKMTMIRRLRTLVARYFEYYKSDILNWEIISVEAVYSMQAPGVTKYYLPMRMDLVVYMKTGKYAGEICTVDHKFTYDFWPQIKIDMNSQIPLYIRALRESIQRGEIEGHSDGVVRRSIFNFLRYRDLPDVPDHELFHRAYPKPEKYTLEAVFNNHMQIAAEIEEIKRLPLAEARKRVTLSLTGSSCQYCDFKRICVVNLQGGDATYEIMGTMKKSTYGYPALEEF